MTSPGLKGDMAFWPPPTAACYCSVCFFNVFLISDIVWATSLPPTALYSQKKVQHFHLERDCTRFCDHVIATLSALPCQKTPLQRWNWRSHWSGWQHGSSSCRAQPLQQVESHRSVPEHLGLGYSPHPETLLCSSSVGPDPARQREQTKISYMIDRNRRGKKKIQWVNEGNYNCFQPDASKETMTKW